VTATDDELLAAVAGLYADLDPAPGDLADGVLAKMAVQDLETEWELLTLVERVYTRAGTRAAAPGEGPETSETTALEFAGTRYRVLVRVGNADDGERRLDGWVVPALPMRVFLGPQGDALAHTRQSAYADRDGRFEFPGPMRGEVRLWLLPQAGGDEPVPPFVTPPFLV
jgi:hypothetical protein